MKEFACAPVGGAFYKRTCGWVHAVSLQVGAGVGADGVRACVWGVWVGAFVVRACCSMCTRCLCACGVCVCARAHLGCVCEHRALRSMLQTCVLEYGCAHAAGVHRTFSL